MPNRNTRAAQRFLNTHTTVLAVLEVSNKEQSTVSTAVCFRTSHQLAVWQGRTGSQVAYSYCFRRSEHVAPLLCPFWCIRNSRVLVRLPPTGVPVCRGHRGGPGADPAAREAPALLHLVRGGGAPSTPAAYRRRPQGVVFTGGVQLVVVVVRLVELQCRPIQSRNHAIRPSAPACAKHRGESCRGVFFSSSSRPLNINPTWFHGKHVFFFSFFLLSKGAKRGGGDDARGPVLPPPQQDHPGRARPRRRPPLQLQGPQGPHGLSRYHGKKGKVPTPCAPLLFAVCVATSRCARWVPEPSQSSARKAPLAVLCMHQYVFAGPIPSPPPKGRAGDRHQPNHGLPAGKGEGHAGPGSGGTVVVPEALPGVLRMPRLDRRALLGADAQVARLRRHHGAARGHVAGERT